MKKKMFERILELAGQPILKEDLEGNIENRDIRLEDQKKRGGSPIDGMSRNKAKRFIQIKSNYDELSKGFFEDNSWEAIRKITKAINETGVEMHLMNTKYYHNEDGVPSGKTWNFEIYFLNNNNKPSTIFCIITAAGAGSVKEPLDRYDITVVLN